MSTKSNILKVKRTGIAHNAIPFLNGHITLSILFNITIMNRIQKNVIIRRYTYE